MTQIAAALAALCIAAPAAAATTAFASLTQLQIVVADLAPDDGVDASFTIEGGRFVYFSGRADEDDHRSLDGPEFLPEETVSFGGATVVGAPDRLVAEATHPGGVASWEWFASGSTSGRMILSPNTSLTVSGVLSAGARCFSSPCGHGSGGASVVLGTDFETVGGLALDGGTEPGRLPSRTESFSFVYDNRSSDSAALGLNIVTGARVSAAPIPEPQTYALLAVGLGAVCAWVRGASQGQASERRQRRSAWGSPRVGRRTVKRRGRIATPTPRWARMPWPAACSTRTARPRQRFAATLPATSSSGYIPRCSASSPKATACALNLSLKLS
ncbi:hypothetical protein OOT46_08955 [Aquabacterium sp. A7-Y]|uniref:PEP-CTERM sorting domain-containing protein n=1 Tax=Aquabacterium sp. A7-Y TaxID=1349605 RepID=UPI00223E4067|nr:PEP-CTERM sorting domain-containing protein [Aquabacterium sp. A7-Y]MCW7537977.1 hypothetical protein [Aquabacterium sp. A7-Y]